MKKKKNDFSITIISERSSSKAINFPSFLFLKNLGRKEDFPGTPATERTLPIGGRPWHEMSVGCRRYLPL